MKPLEIFDEWVNFKATHLDPSTLGNFYHCVRRNLEKFDAAQINRKEAVSFLAWLRQQNLHPETVQRRLKGLKTCWDWAITEGYAVDNPWTGLSKLIKVPPRQAPQPFTREEVQKILTSFEQHPHYNQLFPFVYFLFGTGCRPGEAIGLKWQDVAPDCSTVTIRQQFTQGQFKPTKTGQIRTLNLSPSLQQILIQLKTPRPTELIEYLEQCLKEQCYTPQQLSADEMQSRISEMKQKGFTKTTIIQQLWQVKNGNSSRYKKALSEYQKLTKQSKELPQINDLVFTWKGQPIQSIFFRGCPWISILKAGAIPYRRPYCTRHIFVSHCLEQGLNPVAIARFTGHNVKVLFEYYAGLVETPIIPDLF